MEEYDDLLEIGEEDQNFTNSGKENDYDVPIE